MTTELAKFCTGGVKADNQGEVRFGGSWENTEYEPR